MLNFLGAISSLLPGYVQGRRQAIADNWQDLQNYNNIQQGQLANAFTEATWQPRLDMFADNANLNNLRLRRGLDEYDIWRTYYPGMIDQGWMWSNNAGWNQYLQNLMQNKASNMMLNMPGQAFQQMIMGQNGLNPPPSSVKFGG